MNERTLFEAALNIADPAARRAYLDEACADRPEMRARVETLLQSHESAGSFLDIPAVKPGTPLHTVVVPSSCRDTDDEADNGSPDLSFLQPSSRPGSLGVLGHYEVLEILGQGSFGIVFKAFDEQLHRHVAIKVMNPQIAATSPPRKRFLREARAAAAIRHDYIVQVYSVEEEPLPYLVMEYIQGQTLQQKLDAQGPLELSEILHLAFQIASGLAAAHAMGLIHRDIKPGNILIEQGVEQRVKITDFGLARAADDASLTQTGVISGTPNYMAPEQAQGYPLDQRSDLFSLGSVMYVMASGRLPFRAVNLIAVLKRVVDDTPRPIQEILPEIPAWLVAIVTKLHAKQPSHRFASAQEVADLLSRCLADVQANRPIELPVDMMPSASFLSPLAPDERERTTDREPVNQLSASGELNCIPSSMPRGVLNQAWNNWWSERDRWVVVSVQNVLLIAHLVCMVYFVSMNSNSRKDVAGHKTFAYRLGAPAPWFQIEVYPQPTTPYQTKINPLSSSVLMGLLGCLAYYVYWRIEKVRNHQISPWHHPRFALGLWGAGSVSAVLIGLGMGPFVLGNQQVAATKKGITTKTPVSRDAEARVPADPDRRAAEWVL